MGPLMGVAQKLDGLQRNIRTLNLDDLGVPLFRKPPYYTYIMSRYRNPEIETGETMGDLEIFPETLCESESAKQNSNNTNQIK